MYGERKIVTVLFADVVGSTAMSEQLDPEEFSDIINGAFAFLNLTVNKFGGTVARLMGDAILAFFGAPVSHEDDAERAIRASLEILNNVERYKRKIKQEFHLNFQLRIGIHTGLAVLDTVGNQIKTEYTAMGETPNLASRIQHLAEPDSILISQDTYQLVKNLFEIKPIGTLLIEGKSTPINVYRVLAAKDLPIKTRGLEGVESPLVGREAQLALLLDRLNDLKAGQGALIAVIGEAGLGKSRLLAEFHKQLEPAGGTIAWLEGRSVSFGQSINYDPWRQLIRQSIAASPIDSPAIVREKLRLAVDRYQLNIAILPFLETVLAVGSDESLNTVQDYEGETLVAQMTSSVRDYFQALTKDLPAVIVFDDLHWADTASIHLLSNVSKLVQNSPVLILCLLRPDQSAPGWGLIEQMKGTLGGHFYEIPLQPLTAEESGQLLENLLAIKDFSREVQKLIISKSEGNPFYIEEVIQSLIDTGYIVRENAQWRIKQNVTYISIPNTLAGVLSARIDRLPERTKRVAQMASVIGRVFSWQILEDLFAKQMEGETTRDLKDHIERLREAGIVHEWSRHPELEYAFKHVLLQEAACNSLLIKHRKAFHRRVGEMLESSYTDQMIEFAPAVAHHYWQAGEWMKAAEFSILAGNGAMRVYALREAAGHYLRAVEALEKTADPLPEKLFDAILVWTQAAYKFTSDEQLLEKLDHAEEIARRMNDKYRLTLALNWIANVHIKQGYTSRAMPALIEGYELAKEIGDDRLSLIPSYYWAQFTTETDPRGALAQLEHVIQLTQKFKNRDIEILARAAKGRAHALVGEFSRAQEDIQLALQLAHEMDSQVLRGDVYIMAGYAFLEMDNSYRGMELGQRGAEIALTVNAPDCASTALVCVGFGNLQTLNLHEAKKAFTQSIELATYTGTEIFKNQAEGGLAIVQYFSGDRDAIHKIEEAKANAQALNDLYGAALFSQRIGQIYAEMGNDELAESNLNEALDFYRQTGMAFHHGRTLQLLKDLFEKQGQAGKAQDLPTLDLTTK